MNDDIDMNDDTIQLQIQRNIQAYNAVINDFAIDKELLDQLNTSAGIINVAEFNRIKQQQKIRNSIIKQSVNIYENYGDKIIDLYSQIDKIKLDINYAKSILNSNEEPRVLFQNAKRQLNLTKKMNNLYKNINYYLINFNRFTRIINEGKIPTEGKILQINSSNLDPINSIITSVQNKIWNEQTKIMKENTDNLQITSDNIAPKLNLIQLQNNLSQMFQKKTIQPIIQPQPIIPAPFQQIEPSLVVQSTLPQREFPLPEDDDDKYEDAKSESFYQNEKRNIIDYFKNELSNDQEKLKIHQSPNMNYQEYNSALVELTEKYKERLSEELVKLNKTYNIDTDTDVIMDEVSVLDNINKVNNTDVIMKDLTFIENIKKTNKKYDLLNDMAQGKPKDNYRINNRKDNRERQANLRRPNIIPDAVSPDISQNSSYA